MSIYNNLFNVYDLIKYGYYDAPIKYHFNPIDNSITYGNTNSIYSGIFDLEEYVNYIKNNFLNISSLLTNDWRNRTESITFTIPKTDYTRRIYKFPNLFSYTALSNFIVSKRLEIETQFDQDTNSTSKYFQIEGFNYYQTKEFEKTILSYGKNILHVDLANFYHTLYTHSIDWAERGRNNAKSSLSGGNNNNFIGFDLDNFVKNCQFGETHGIPAGNLISRIIAEYYMSYFDQRLRFKGITRFSRYVDDFKFSYTDESEKDKFLLEFNKICVELGLFVNQNKTFVEKYPGNLVNSKAFIDNFDGKFSPHTWHSTIRKKYSDLIDKCIQQEHSGNKGSIKYLLSSIPDKFYNFHSDANTIETVFFSSEESAHFSVYEKLIDLSFLNSNYSNVFMVMTDRLLSRGISQQAVNQSAEKYFTKNEQRISTNIRKYAFNNYHQEIYQILLYAYEFDIDLYIENHIEDIFNPDADDFSLILASLIYIRKYLAGLVTIDKLLEYANLLLTESHKEYQNINHFSRMKEKFWLFRYFMYSMINSGIIKKSVVNSYLAKINCKNSRHGFKSELNSKYTFSADSNDTVSKFFEKLLEEDVHLVNIIKLIN